MNTSELPDGWAIARLGDLGAGSRDFLVGGPFGSDLTSSDYQVEPGVPVIRGSNLGGDAGEFVDDGFVFVSEEKAHLLRRSSAGPGDIIFTQRGTLGQVAIIPNGSRFPRYVISQSQMRMTPDIDRINPRFLFHFFRCPKSLSRISARALTTGVPHINLGILREFPVELPSLPEQRRIAEVLDRAEALRAKRRAAIAKLDTLTQAIFLDMFGDPAANPKGWHRIGLPDVAVGTYGIKAGPFGSSLKKQDYTTGGYRVYGQEQVITGRLDIGDYYISERKYQQLKGCAVREGDLLVSLVGSFGKVLVVPPGIEPGIINPRLLKITPNHQLLTSGFLAAFLALPITQAQFERMSHGGTMGILNVGILKQLHVVLPPLALQREFGCRTAAVEKLKAAHRASLIQLDALFASFQHRAFRGEL